MFVNITIQLKHIFLFCFVISSFFANSQTTENTYPFKFGIEGSATLFDFQLGKLETNSGTKRILASPFNNNNEFSSNFFVTKSTPWGIELKSGIGYKYKFVRQSPFSATYSAPNPFDPTITDVWIVDFFYDTELSFKRHSHYIVIPIGVLFQVSKNIKVELACDVEFFLAGKNKIVFPGSEDDSLTPNINHLILDNDIMISPYLGFEFDLFDTFFVKPFVSFSRPNNYQEIFVKHGLKVGKLF